MASENIVTATTEAVSTVIPGWVSFLVVAVPLFGLAGSAVGYVRSIFLDRKVRRRAEFFELMSYIDDPTLPIATKLAAVYQLREFEGHREFVIRFCETQKNQILGNNSQSLRDEMDLTVKAMRSAGER